VAWQPLHVRLGVEERPYAGVPGHLQGPLWDWVVKAFDAFTTVANRARKPQMLYISTMARLSLTPAANDRDILRQIQSCCFRDES
jgi:hypothetical protein